jgi:hypothetical protein
MKRAFWTKVRELNALVDFDNAHCEIRHRTGRKSTEISGNADRCPSMDLLCRLKCSFLGQFQVGRGMVSGYRDFSGTQLTEANAW